jgi:hypothetical protein
MLRRFTSERIRKAHHRRIVLRVSLSVGLIVSFFLFILALFSSKQVAIRSVLFEGNKAVSDEELFALVTPHLEGTYAHLLSRRNIFIFPKDAIEADILTSFVRIESVVIDREGLSKILVAVVERDPAGLWCGPAIVGSPVATASCYFIDETALAFAVAPRMNGGSFVIYERALPLKPIGKTLESSEGFNELGHLIDSFATLGFNTRRVIWKEDALELVTMFSTKTGEEGVRLRVPLAGPYEQAFTNLASIVQSQKSKKVGADEEPFVFVDLEYIDLRFENKIFYKKEAGAASVIE